MQKIIIIEDGNQTISYTYTLFIYKEMQFRLYNILVIQITFEINI